MKRSNNQAFTLTELMIVVAIITIVSVIGAITLNSRMHVSRLEDAAQTLASDLAYARSAALFKGCPTRIILCTDRNCSSSGRAVKQRGGSGGKPEFIGSSSDDPANYYATLREAQYSDGNGDCYVSSGSDPDGGAPNGYNYMDFDRRPQAIPSGIVFNPIYSGTNQVINYSDWSSTSSSEASNSLWFPTSISDSNANDSLANIPVDTPQDSKSAYVVFQLSLDSCDSTDPHGDCVAYFVTMDTSGETGIRRCTPGSRTANQTDTCF